MGRIKELKIGKLLRVTKGIPETDKCKWLCTGDIVRIIGIYPHIIMVERVKPFQNIFSPGATSKHMRQCYPIASLHLNLAELGDLGEEEEKEIYDSELWEKIRKYNT